MLGYWSKAFGSLIGNILRDFSRQKNQRFEFTKKLISSGMNYDCRPLAETIPFLKLYPSAEALMVPLGDVRYRQSNATPYEIYCLLCTAILKDAKRIFEIGTFDGATTYLLAKSCPESKVFTIDLAPESISNIAGSLVKDEISNVEQSGVGSRFIGTPQQKQIVQIYGDSTRYDYRELYSTMDLVFVDACHEYEFVRSDSQTALNLVKPDGVIIWHDYEVGWPGVVKAVNELTASKSIKHIDKTAIAVLDLAAPENREAVT